LEQQRANNLGVSTGRDVGRAGGGEATAVLTLGYEQYVEGRLKNFQTVYVPTWEGYWPLRTPLPETTNN